MVKELRLALTVDDFDGALAFYRDTLGLELRDMWVAEGSRGVLLEAGRATLELEGQTLNLKPGDSWLVPAGATHHYTIIEPFTAVEATAPPAEVHGRDTPE